MIYDVVVVGAGPAGATAACLLSRGGARVALLEKAQIPRRKVCGGGVVFRARGLFPADIRSVVEFEARKVRVSLLDRKQEFVVERPEAQISMVRRDRLDALIAQEAGDAGAELFPARSVTGFGCSGELIQVTSPAGAFKARAVVLADGAGSNLAGLAGWRKRPFLVGALEAEAYPPDKVMARFSGEARFDFDHPSDGYSWVFPKKDHLSVGVVSMRRRGRSLKQLLKEYARILEIPSESRFDVHGFVIPVKPRPEGVARRGFLLAGDSAGLADPVTGEGITNAVLSGRLAAQALLGAQGDPARAAVRYRALMADVVAELRTALFLGRALYTPLLRRAFLGRWGELFAEQTAEVFLGRTSFRRIVRTPANYFRLLGHRSRR